MHSNHLQSVLTEIPHLDDDGIRDLYHETVLHSMAFHTFLQTRLAAMPGETDDTWLERRLNSLARDQLMLLLLAITDGGFDDALRFMAHHLGVAAERRRMPPRRPLFGLPVRTAAAAGLPFRTAAGNNTAAPHPETGFEGGSDQSDFGRWYTPPQTGVDGLPDFTVAVPPPAPTLDTTPLRQPAATDAAPFNPLEQPAPSARTSLDVLADVAVAVATLDQPQPQPTPKLSTTPLRHPATAGTARFNPLERPTGSRRPLPRAIAPAPPAPAPPKPSPEQAGNPLMDWRPQPPGALPPRPAHITVAMRMRDLPESPQHCVRCGSTYLEAHNTGRRTCRYHAEFPVADAGATTAWDAAAAAGVATEPHFRPSLFGRADLAGAFIWPCCLRRGGGPGPDPGCRYGIHVSDETRLWRAPNFRGWERYGRQSQKEEGGESKGGE